MSQNAHLHTSSTVFQCIFETQLNYYTEKVDRRAFQKAKTFTVWIDEQYVH